VLKKISLLHPFSAKAIGLNEEDLCFSHSKPHEMALLKIQSKKLKVSIDYFTGGFFFTKKINGLIKKFWPVSKPLFRDRHKWRQQFSFFHFVSNFFNAPDVTIINMSGHGSKYIFKLAKALVKSNKPYVAMIGGLHMSIKGNALEYYCNAHHIIVHTVLQKRELLSYKGFEQLDIRVMPLGVDIEKFTPKDKNDFESINLLYVGRISRLKQIELTIETVAELQQKQNKKVVLKIIGPISDVDYYNELRGLVKELNIYNNIIFVGAIKQNELIPYYQKSDLLLLPSAHESFGMVMIEAMACGTPVAALRNSGGPDEIVTNKVTGILSEKENYVLDVLNHFDSIENQKSLSRESRLEVLNKYSIEVTTKVLKESIESALA